MSADGLCTVTITERKYRCGLTQGHDGRHEGRDSDWVWWHGNGEECDDNCPRCGPSMDTPLFTPDSVLATGGEANASTA
jgi:hypothetical protein